LNNRTFRTNVLLILPLCLMCCGWSVAAYGEDRVITLEEAYRAALGGSELIKIAEEGVLQSEERVDQAWTYLYPRVNAQGAYTRFNKTLPPEGGLFLFQPLGQFQAAVTLQQPLYTGGRTMAALRTAKAMKEVGSNDIKTTRQDLLFRVAEAYYGVLRAQRTVELTRSSLQRMERHQETTRREAETRTSKANQSALLRANSLVSQSRIALIRAQDAVKTAGEKLSLLTGLPQEVRLSEPPRRAPSVETPDELRTKALLNREDLASAKINQKIAAENITITEGGHYPQVSAVAGAQYQNSQPEMMTDATVYYAGLRLQMPLFEGGIMKHETAEAKSRLRQTELNSEFLRKAIGSEVYEGYVNIQTVTAVLATAKQQVEYAKGNFDAVDGLYADGLLPSLSMIDAEQALTMAEREQMNAEYDLQVAILRLHKSTGTLAPEQ
jgi:outer membrane protein